MPIAMSISRLASAASVSRRSERLVAAGHQRNPQARLFRERRDPLEVLAGEHFGRRHHRGLPSRLDHVGHREQRDDGFARADVALQKPDHPLRGPEIRADFIDRPALRASQRKRQRGLEAAAERPFSDMRATCARPHPGPHEKQRQLVGEQFVIGEAGRASSGRIDVIGRSRPMHRLERLGEARQIQPIERLRADPFGQARQALQCSVGGADHGALKEALGQAVDGLDGGKVCEFLGAQDPVGVNNLAESVIELELAGDPASRSHRQARADPLGIGEKEDELDVAGVVLDQHLERRTRARARRLAMLRDFCLDSHDRSWNRVADFRPRAPVDGRMGQMEQHVDDPRALRLVEQAVEKFCILGSDPRQRLGRGEQRIEEGRAHVAFLYGGGGLGAKEAARKGAARGWNLSRGSISTEII